MEKILEFFKGFSSSDIKSAFNRYTLDGMGSWSHFSQIVLMLAACGAFLIGFKFLSDNMEKLFGSSLKQLFNKTSDQKLVGVGMGAVSTAVVQSSGITTVMVVGFVNAGIMSLYQAATVIMGANIGTTITAQIAAWGSSFDIAPIFMLMLFAGAMMDMISKNDKVKSIGLAIAGLGLVFFGLEIMSDAMGIYKEMPAVQNFLSDITNPFLLLIFGIVFTALLQSSSAVTTIIIAMASQGLLIGGGGNAVLYIILGSNIGSTVTALISSIGTSVNARRASMMHLLFNTIGTILFMILLLVWSEGVVGADFFNATFVKWFDGNPEIQIAMFHTFFNVTCTLMFLPFTKALVKMASLLIPEKEQKEKDPSELVYMDKRFLATPAVAVGQLCKDTFRMADIAMESLSIAFNGFINRDLEAMKQVSEHNETVATISGKISDYLVRVSAGDTSLKDEKAITALHNNIGDIARISELADNFTKYTNRAVKDNLVFSEGINEKLGVMHDLLHEQYAYTKRIMLENQRSLISESDALEDRIDTMRRDLVAEHITRLSQGKCRPENNTIFVNLVCNLERIGDHLNFIVHSTEN